MYNSFQLLRALFYPTPRIEA